MPQLCLYLQLHQPYRLGEFSVFDISHQRSYFDHASQLNAQIMRKVAAKSYLPMLRLLLRLVEQHPVAQGKPGSGFTFALSTSGVFLEQAEQYQPEVITLLQRLTATGQVEFLAETYYHSLACLYSPAEFKIQVHLHERKIKQLFNQQPVIFRNTELVYSNGVGQLVTELGYQGMLTEAVDRYLHGREQTLPYWNTTLELPLLLKHAQLSDDIAFRFSNRAWEKFPLTVAKYLPWLEVYPEDQVVNLFMDFETFGEHQWADTGIFTFFEHLVASFLQKKWNRFVTPSQMLSPGKSPSDQDKAGKVYDVPAPISWADIDRDLTAWIDNPFQRDALTKLYQLEEAVLSSGDPDLIEDWRKLQTSDHFYYMCTKWSEDGDVHAYFSPYRSPHEAYRKYAIVLADLQERLL